MLSKFVRLNASKNEAPRVRLMLGHAGLPLLLGASQIKFPAGFAGSLIDDHVTTAVAVERAWGQVTVAWPVEEIPRLDSFAHFGFQVGGQPLP